VTVADARPVKPVESPLRTGYAAGAARRQVNAPVKLRNSFLLRGDKFQCG
jgi:hypothetical protein